MESLSQRVKQIGSLRSCPSGRHSPSVGGSILGYSDFGDWHHLTTLKYTLLGATQFLLLDMTLQTLSSCVPYENVQNCLIYLSEKWGTISESLYRDFLVGLSTGILYSQGKGNLTDVTHNTCEALKAIIE